MSNPRRDPFGGRNRRRPGISTLYSASRPNGLNSGSGLTSSNMPTLGNFKISQLALPVAPAASSAPPSFGNKQSIPGLAIHNSSGSTKNVPATAAQNNAGASYSGLQSPALDAFFSPEKPETRTPFTDDPKAADSTYSNAHRSDLPGLCNYTNTHHPPLVKENMSLSKESSKNANKTGSFNAVAPSSSLLEPNANNSLRDNDQNILGDQAGAPGIPRPQRKMAVMKKRLKNDTIIDQNEERPATGENDAVALPATRPETKKAVQAINTQALLSQSGVVMVTPQPAIDIEIRMETPPDEILTLANDGTNGSTPLGATSALMPINFSRSQDAPIMHISSNNDEMPLSRQDIIEAKGKMKQAKNVRTMGKEFVRPDQKLRPTRSCLKTPARTRLGATQRKVTFGRNKAETLAQEARGLREQCRIAERNLEVSQNGRIALADEVKRLRLELATAKKDFDAQAKRVRALERDNQEMKEDQTFPEVARTGYKRKISQLEDENRGLLRDKARLEADKAYWSGQFSVQLEERTSVEERYERELKAAIKQTKMHGFTGFVPRKPIDYIKQSAIELENIRNKHSRELSDRNDSIEFLQEENRNLRKRLQNPKFAQKHPRYIPSWAEHIEPEPAQNVLQGAAFGAVKFLAAAGFAGYLVKAVVSYLS